LHRKIGLFCGNSALFCRKMKLFCRKTGLVGGKIGFFAEIQLSLSKRFEYRSLLRSSPLIATAAATHRQYYRTLV
jgi:hypothetical protein